MAELEIIGMPQSNYVWACRIAATEKGVPHTLVPARPHTPEIDAIHPFGRMPAMRHGTVTLCESKAIATYIDRAFKGPELIPTDPVGAAETEQWVSLVNTSVDPLAFRAYVIGYYFPGTPDGSPNRAVIDAAVPKIEPHLAALDKAVAATGFLAAGRFTFADMNAVPILYYLDRMPESGAILARMPKLKGYLAQHIERASIKATLPPPMPGRG